MWIKGLPDIVGEMQPEQWTTISGDLPTGALEGVIARLLASARALGIQVPGVKDSVSED